MHLRLEINQLMSFRAISPACIAMRSIAGREESSTYMELEDCHAPPSAGLAMTDLNSLEIIPCLELFLFS